MNPSNGILSYDVLKSAVLSRFLPSGKQLINYNKKDLDLRMIYKRNFTLQSATDERTGNRLYRGTMRYGIGVFNWRGAYASFA